MRKWIKVTPLLVCLCFSIVLGNGCRTSDSKEQSKQQSAQGALNTVATAYQPCYNSYIMEVARDKGYYKEFGIQPEFQMYSSGAPQNEAIASDKWKTGVLGMASILASIRYGAKIVAIADFEGKLNTLFVRSNSDILKVKGYFKDKPDLYGSPETIKGKTIITTIGTSAHYAVERLVSYLWPEDDRRKSAQHGPAVRRRRFHCGTGRYCHPVVAVHLGR